MVRVIGDVGSDPNNSSRKRNNDEIQSVLSENHPMTEEQGDQYTPVTYSTVATATHDYNNVESPVADPLANYLSSSHDQHDHKLLLEGVSAAGLVGTNHLGIPHDVVQDELSHVKPHKNFLPWVEQKVLLSPMDVASKKRSPFWQAFHQFNTKHVANQNRQHHACCNLCGKTVNMGRDNSTTTLSQHLRKCNRNLWTQLKSTIIVRTEVEPEEETKEEEEETMTGTNYTKEDVMTIKSGTSQGALKHYIQVAFSVRFNKPPEEEWPGLVMILHKELNQRLSKETIRDIFHQMHLRNSSREHKRSSKKPKRYAFQTTQQQPPLGTTNTADTILYSPVTNHGNGHHEGDETSDEEDDISSSFTRIDQEMSHDLHLHTLESLPSFP